MFYEFFHGSTFFLAMLGHQMVEFFSRMKPQMYSKEALDPYFYPLI